MNEPHTPLASHESIGIDSSRKHSIFAVNRLLKILSASSPLLCFLLAQSCSLAAPSDNTLATQCPQGAKVCNGLCYSVLDPLVGCGSSTCDPCEQVPNAVSMCSVGGICQVGECADGFADCDNDLSNGCEVDIRQNIEHCGGCGQHCSAEGGIASCNDTICTISVCGLNVRDCDKDTANGCETSILDDDNHCGRCGNRCDGDTKCVSGSCVANNVATWLSVHNGGWCNSSYNKFINLCGDVAFCYEPSYLRKYPNGIAVDIGLYYDGGAMGTLLDAGGDCDEKRMTCLFTEPGILQCSGPLNSQIVTATVLAGRHLVSYRISQKGSALFLDGNLVQSGNGADAEVELGHECDPGFVLGQRMSYWWEPVASAQWLRMAPFFFHLRDDVGSWQSFSLDDSISAGAHSVVLLTSQTVGNTSSVSWDATVGTISPILCGGTSSVQTSDSAVTRPCDVTPGWTDNLEALCSEMFN